MAEHRYIQKFIQQDLKNKMVFLGGPRQVGKTTLSKNIGEITDSFEYFNWDYDSDRKALLEHKWSSEKNLIIFDELHKYPHWKQWIKGIYDVKPENQNYFVTGSARLDTYKKGGDSLLGRYHYWRLHPFSIDELPDHISQTEGLERLLTLGGFPEPFLSGDERLAKRWRRDRFDRVLREDVRDLENIRELKLLELFIDSLRQRAGNLITISNIASDLQISPKTAQSWLELAERLYMCFPIYPYTKNIPRSILKPPKVYFFDNGDLLTTGGSRLENLVATSLLKRLHFKEDFEGCKCQLHYIRDKDGREVDFITIIDGKVHELIEVKSSDSDISSSLKYYHKLLAPEKTLQLVKTLKRPYDKDGIKVISIVDYFTNPPWNPILPT